MFIPNLANALRKLSGLQNPLLDKSLNLNALNSVFSSLYLPVDLKLNLFFNSFSNLNFHVYYIIFKITLPYL